jgi:uncharacterized LabA/DUF88 family protein
LGKSQGAELFLQELSSVRTYVYVDGFNFYYGAVKDTRHKWLDLMALFKRVLDPKYDIRAIKYFTAHVSPINDPQQSQRQAIYIKAFQAHIPEIEIILGKFMAHPVRVPLVQPLAGQSFALVLRTEEKGSDVNLAVHLVNDAWLDRYDAAVIVSNDSDLAAALHIVRDERNKEVILLTPPKFQRKRSKMLKNACTRSMTIKPAYFAQSQLPDPIPNTNLFKPPQWA